MGYGKHSNFYSKVDEYSHFVAQKKTKKPHVSSGQFLGSIYLVAQE